MRMRFYNIRKTPREIWHHIKIYNMLNYNRKNWIVIYDETL